MSVTGIVYARCYSTRLLFYNQHFYKQRQTEIGKNLSKCKQHPEAELLLFENCSYSSSALSSKSNRTCSKK